MTDEILEKNLREFDFSSLSKVKESLLEEILKKYDARNLKSVISEDEILTDEDLDYAVAAGNPNFNKKYERKF